MSPFLWEHLRGWAEAEHSFVCQCEDVTMWGDLDCFIGDSCRSWFSSVTSGATARPSVLWCASLTVPCCAVSIPGARLRNVEVRKATWDLKHLQSGDGKSSSLRFYFCCVLNNFCNTFRQFHGRTTKSLSVCFSDVRWLDIFLGTLCWDCIGPSLCHSTDWRCWKRSSEVLLHTWHDSSVTQSVSVSAAHAKGALLDWGLQWAPSEDGNCFHKMMDTVSNNTQVGCDI